MEYFFKASSFEDERVRAFIQAVAAGNVAEAVSMARSNPKFLNSVGVDGETAILISVERRNADILVLLLKEGSNPNGSPGMSPLGLSILFPDLILARILLEYGADPNGEFDGNSALHRSGVFGKVEAAKLLLSYGVRIDSIDKFGITPSLAAAAADNWHIVELLINSGASLSHISDSGSNIGSYANNSFLSRTSDRGQARDRIIQKWKEGGLPWPPPRPWEAQELVRTGRWKGNP